MPQTPPHTGSSTHTSDLSHGDVRTWFITGASSGLGRALAEHVLDRGERVALAARSVPALEQLVERVLVNNAAVDFIGAIEEQREAD